MQIFLPIRTRQMLVKGLALLEQHWIIALLGILSVSILFKLALRIPTLGEADYWTDGYSFYTVMADNFIRDRRIYLGASANPYYAFRPPMYPLFIAFVRYFTDNSAVAFVITQSMISTLTIVAVYVIGTTLGGHRVGFLAAFLYAFHPYPIVHDTALQETALYTSLSTVAIMCLLLALRRSALWLFFISGALLGLTILTRISHSLVTCLLCFVTAWLLWRYKAGSWRKVSALVLGAFLIVLPWLIYVNTMTNHWALTSETGFALARAHNQYTFQFFPWQSIDLSWAEYHRNMGAQQIEELRTVRPDEFAAEQWYQNLAIDYIRQHPWQTVWNGIYKVSVIFSGIHSPLGSSIKNGVYAAAYWLLTILALISLRSIWRTEFFWIYITMLAAFSATTFVFWSHTSHRAFLDPPLAVFAGIGLASALAGIGGKQDIREKGSSSQHKMAH